MAQVSKYVLWLLHAGYCAHSMLPLPLGAFLYKAPYRSAFSTNAFHLLSASSTGLKIFWSTPEHQKSKLINPGPMSPLRCDETYSADVF